MSCPYLRNRSSSVRWFGLCDISEGDRSCGLRRGSGLCLQDVLGKYVAEYEQQSVAELRRVRRCALQLLLGAAGDLREGFGVPHGELGQHLAVHIHPREL